MRVYLQSVPRTLLPVLTFALCILPFCISLPESLQPPPTPASQEPVLPGVVQLLAVGPSGSGNNRECSATGFFVNEEGYLVTNAHVVKDLQQCLAKVPGTKILAKFRAADSAFAEALPCDLVGLDDGHDVAVLKADFPLRTGPLPTGSYALLGPDDATERTPVVVSGHPGFSWQPVTQSGQVIGRESLRLGKGDPEPTEVFELNISLQPGNSGSPVYHWNGKGVIAVVVSKHASLPSLTLAVSIRHAIDLLNRYKVKWCASAGHDPDM